MQLAIGSDILVVLDDCRDAEISRTEAKKSVDRTIRWADECKNYLESKNIKRKIKLSAVVQGANYLDLRKYCAQELVKMDFDGYNFGGAMINRKGNLVTEQMKVVADNTPSDKFKYAMGVGKPEDIIASAKLGYTVFDTVLVTRNARHGTLYVNPKNIQKINIRNAIFRDDLSPIDSTCDCIVCQNYSRAYIHHLLRAKEITGQTLASIHNLYFYQSLIDLLNKIS